MKQNIEETYKINIAGTGKTFFCKKDEFVIQAMLSAGCGPIHYGCCGGGCGICKMKVISGDFRVVKAMSKEHISDSQKKMGEVLICCIKPDSDMILAKV